MKKNKLIILLLIFFIMPMLIKADMAAPMSSYEVRISNPEGAEIYEWNNDSKSYEKTSKKLNYDEIYYINYEQIRNNELFGYAVVREKIDGGYTFSDGGLIKLSDTKPLEVKLEDHKKETKAKYYVFDDSCYLYNGPSEIYGKVEPEISLRVGTTIETEYYDDMWAYIEYNGVKGWVYTYSYNSIPENASGMVYISGYRPNIKSVKELTMYKNPKTEEEIGMIIPQETELNTIYVYSLLVHNPYYYVEYNGVKGWVKTIYEDNIVMNIAYPTIEGTKATSKEGAILYQKPGDENSTIGIVSSGIELTAMYYLANTHNPEWYQVKYNDTIGWIKFKDIDFEYEEDNDIIPESPTTPDDSVNNQVSTNQSTNSINEKILYYVGGVVILSITAVVTIILINKKKKEKNVNK